MPKQVEYDEVFMDFAERISQMSKCVSKQVGAVLVKDNRIVSHGVNGSKPGEMNCRERFPAYDPETMRTAHIEWSQRFEYHAEANCIAFALKNGIDVSGCTIYVTLAPCFDCLKSFISLFGIQRVVYNRVYDRCDISQVISTAKGYDVVLEDFNRRYDVE